MVKLFFHFFLGKKVVGKKYSEVVKAGGIFWVFEESEGVIMMYNSDYQENSLQKLTIAFHDFFLVKPPKNPLFEPLKSYLFGKYLIFNQNGEELLFFKITENQFEPGLDLIQRYSAPMKGEILDFCTVGNSIIMVTKSTNSYNSIMEKGIEVTEHKMTKIQINPMNGTLKIFPSVHIFIGEKDPEDVVMYLKELGDIEFLGISGGASEDKTEKVMLGFQIKKKKYENHFLLYDTGKEESNIDFVNKKEIRVRKNMKIFNFNILDVNNDNTGILGGFYYEKSDSLTKFFGLRFNFNKSKFELMEEEHEMNYSKEKFNKAMRLKKGNCELEAFLTRDDKDEVAERNITDVLYFVWNNNFNQICLNFKKKGDNEVNCEDDQEEE